MNEKIKYFEKESGLEIYGLGARQEQWESVLEKFTALVIDEVVKVIENPKSYNKCVYTTFDAGIAGCVAQEISNSITKHFKDTQYERTMG